MTSAPASPPAPAPTTLGELRAGGHVLKPVKAEVRDNLLARLAAGETAFPGILGFDDTVLPQVERALLAGHDLVLLGERGQGKTRLIRTLVGLLDEWTPVLAGSELNEHPYEPISPWGHRQVAEHGDATPVAWRHRSDRYGEKLATPDTSVGDLIGDVDPIKVAEGRTLGDPETVHYGLVPRTNRGIFSVNELPDLAERIQVSLLNVLEERDIQVRGYTLRLPLDLLLVASANPEDYTNRGRIITPLKDRFGAEVRTHYPLELADEVRLIRQEAQLAWPGTNVTVPDHLLQVVARYTRLVRESPQVDQRSGVSARFAVAAAETVAASAVRRAAITGRGAGRRAGVRPAVGRRGLPRQGRVRGGRGGPRARGAPPPAAPRDRRRVPRAAGRHRPHRAAGPLRGGRDRRDGRPRAGERAARPPRHRPGPGRAARPARRRGGVARARRRRARVRARGAAPQPAARQGRGGGPDRLRRPMSARAYRYGSWSGGRDPLEPPYDVASALDQIGEQVLDGASPRQALRDLLRKGADGLRGLDDLRRQVAKRQRQARQKGQLDGTLQEVRELLEKALEAERRELFPDPSDAARMRELELDTLPNDTARAVQALKPYDWRSSGGARGVRGRSTTCCGARCSTASSRG